MKNRWKNLLWVGAVAAFLPNCLRVEEVPAAEMDKPSFFDLSDYMEAEMKRLQALQPRVIKRVLLKGEVQERAWDSLNYQQELKPFADSDINRPAWYDKYRVDTLTSDTEDTYQVRYRSLEGKLRVQELLVEFQADTGRVLAIEVTKETNSLIEELRQTLHYTPAKGYRLESEQDPILGEGHRALVEVRWIKK